MSITLQSIAWKTGLGTSAKFILISLCDHADDDGWGVYPSFKYTAMRTGVSFKTVQRAVAHFKRVGLLKEVRPAAHHWPAEYRVMPRKLRDLARENQHVWDSLKEEQEQRHGDTVRPPKNRVDNLTTLPKNNVDNRKKRVDKSAGRVDTDDLEGGHSDHLNISRTISIKSGKSKKQNVDNSTKKPDKQTPEAARSAIADINWNGHED